MELREKNPGIPSEKWNCGEEMWNYGEKNLRIPGIPAGIQVENVELW